MFNPINASYKIEKEYRDLIWQYAKVSSFFKEVGEKLLKGSRVTDQKFTLDYNPFHSKQIVLVPPDLAFKNVIKKTDF